MQQFAFQNDWCQFWYWIKMLSHGNRQCYSDFSWCILLFSTLIIGLPTWYVCGCSLLYGLWPYSVLCTLESLTIYVEVSVLWCFIAVLLVVFHVDVVQIWKQINKYLSNSPLHKAKGLRLHGFDRFYSSGAVRGREWEVRPWEGTLPTIPYQPLALWIGL